MISLPLDEAVISFPSHLFMGSLEGEMASTFSVDRLNQHTSQTRMLVGLGVSMPAVSPPLPSSLFPMLGIEQRSLALLSRNVNQPSLPKYVDPELSEQVEQSLPAPRNHTSPIVFGKVLVGLGLRFDDLTEASVESQPPPVQSIAENEVALPPFSDFYLQAHNSLNFVPLVQHTTPIDAAQLERQSALYNLEHSNLVLDHIFSHSPPIRLEKRTETERQLPADLFKKKSHHNFKSQQPNSAITSPDDPRSPILSTLERVFLPFASPNSPSFTFTSPDSRIPSLSTLERVFLPFPSPSSPSPSLKSQRSGSVLRTDQPGTQPKSAVPFRVNKNMQIGIGLGLPSRLALHRNLRLHDMYSQESIERQSRRASPECHNLSVIVTEPSFTMSPSSVQRVQSSNRFLKPSQFTQRPLYDIVEVPTPPPSSSSSPSGTPDPRIPNQWSFPFTRINAPQRLRFRLSTSSPVIARSDTVVEATNVDRLSEPPLTRTTSTFKWIISKFAKSSKRSRLLKTSLPFEPRGSRRNR